MALVASPTSVWRDPNVMSTSAVSNLEQPSLLPLHPVTSTEGGVYQFMGVPAHPKRENPTPTPPHMGSSDSESTIKDENGQDITCVVCGDKSSGKHYGQFTCEGNVYAICLHCLDNLLPIYVICKPFLRYKRGLFVALKSATLIIVLQFLSTRLFYAYDFT